MKTLALTLAVLFSCTHLSASADLDGFPERKDSGPKIVLAPSIQFESAVDEESALVFLLLLDAHIKAGEKAILVELDTPGGSVNAGLVMSKAIERSPVPVVCVVDGMAASMGLYILQSCDVRVMTKRSLLMGHAPALKVDGHDVELEESANMLRHLSRAMAYHITSRTRISVDDYLSKIADGRELWLDADEAVDFKFVDFAVDSVDEVAQTVHRLNAQ